MGALLDGRVVAVAGAGRGIGREIAPFCIREGAAVIVNDRGAAGDDNDACPTDTTANDIVAAGLRAFAAAH